MIDEYLPDDKKMDMICHLDKLEANQITCHKRVLTESRTCGGFNYSMFGLLKCMCLGLISELAHESSKHITQYN
jgi:hypothetical protein